MIILLLTFHLKKHSWDLKLKLLIFSPPVMEEKKVSAVKILWQIMFTDAALLPPLHYFLICTTLLVFSGIQVLIRLNLPFDTVGRSGEKGEEKGLTA